MCVEAYLPCGVAAKEQLKPIKLMKETKTTKEQEATY